MKRITILALALILASPLAASWYPRSPVQADQIGYAIHTPTVVTSLEDAPDEGVVLPAKAVTVTLCTTGKLRYTFGDLTPTATKGAWLEEGCHNLTNDGKLISELQFIDDTTGATTVTVLFFGER